DGAPVSEGLRRIVQFINVTPKCTRRQLVEALAPSPAVTAAAGAAATPPTPGEPLEASPEATAVIGDLHWLIHQGHVIEFANGILETAKKPLPKPPKPAAPVPEAVKGESAPLEPGANTPAVGAEVPAEAAPDA